MCAWSLGRAGLLDPNRGASIFDGNEGDAAMLVFAVSIDGGSATPTELPRYVAAPYRRGKLLS